MTTAVTVTDRSALAAALRTLKLSGMLATLDARLAQAGAGELGHLDFLQVLCQDEINRRDSMSLSKRIRRARFETEATLEGFDFAAAPKLPAAQIRDLAALRWLAAGESVILYGPVGRRYTVARRWQTCSDIHVKQSSWAADGGFLCVSDAFGSVTIACPRGLPGFIIWLVPGARRDVLGQRA
jgi:hypothetical protein